MPDFSFKHTEQADKPNVSADTMKANFDSQAVEIRDYINSTLKTEVDAKVSTTDLTNLAGAGRTTETVKGNADAIATHKAEDASQDNVHGLRNKKVVLGENSSVQYNNSIAIGTRATVTTGGGLAIGMDTICSSGGVAIGWDTISSGGVAIGFGDYESTTANDDSIAIGTDTIADGEQAIAIGLYANANGTSSIAIGHNSVAEGSYATALSAGKAYNSNEGVLGVAISSNYGANSWKVPGSFTVQGTKNFEIPHPKPEKSATHRIRHGAVESPTAGDTLYRFVIESTKENDMQYINLPDYFIYLNKDVQIFVTPQGHFGNGYGVINEETEQLEIHCQNEGEYNVLVIGTRNDNHQSVQDWDIKGVEREIGISWTGETYVFSVDEIIEVEEIKEVI